MKRPITSPWSAVFTSSATITLIPFGALARLERARDLVVVGDGDRARGPARFAVSSSVSTGVAQSGEWSVCMCRSTWTNGALGQPLAHARRCRSGRGGARRSRRRAPRSGRRCAPTRAPVAARCDRARRARRSSAGSETQPLELAGERRARRAARTAGRARRRASDLLVLRAAATRPEPRRRPARAAPAAARARRPPTPPPPPGRAPGTGPRSRPPGRRAHAVAQPRAAAARRARARVAQPDRGAPVAASSGSRRSARRKSRSAARSSSAENTISGGPSVGARRGRSEVGARADQPVVAGEEALHEVAGHAEAGGAPVEAAEQELHHAPRHLRREDPLGGAWKRAHVQRARVAQRRRRRARRERLVHVHEVELGVLEQVLDRARHVERQRHRAAARRNGRLCPTASSEAPPRSREHRVRVRGQAARSARARRAPARASPTARPPPRGGRARRARRRARST